MAVRGRTRGVEQGNPYIVRGILAAILGLILLGLAAWYYSAQSAKRAHQLKIARGIELVNKLSEPVAQYFYSGKGLSDKRELLPPEAWALFTEQDGEADFVDAMVTRFVKGENRFTDAFRYKTGRDAYGEPIPGRMTTTKPDTKHGDVDISEATCPLGGKIRPIIIFRRPIPVAPDKSEFYGRAMIILLADVPVPGATSGSSPSTPAMPKPEVKVEDKPAGKTEPKTEAKPDSKPAEKPAAETEVKK